MLPPHTESNCAAVTHSHQLLIGCVQVWQLLCRDLAGDLFKYFGNVVVYHEEMPHFISCCLLKLSQTLNFKYLSQVVNRNKSGLLFKFLEDPVYDADITSSPKHIWMRIQFHPSAVFNVR